MELTFSKADYHINGDGFWLSIGVDATDGRNFLNDFKPEKKYTADIKIYRERRSLNANAYFHFLAHKIAERLDIGDDEEKRALVLEYGVISTDPFGTVIGFKLPENVDPLTFWKYPKFYGYEKTDKGIWAQYIAYKETHRYDTKEMSRLIEGTVSEAKELGIQTLTPDEIENLKNLWWEYAQTNEENDDTDER